MTERTALTDDDLLTLFEGALADEAARALMARVQDDPAAQATLAQWAEQNDALATLYPVDGDTPIPARLTDVIRNAKAEGAIRPALLPWRRMVAALAILAVGLGGGWLLHGAAGTTPAIQTLAAAALTAHETFVGEVRHPVEVLASDAAHLNTWMSKRLGRDMRPPDLAASGFALLGGRIVPALHGAAGLYMYENAAGQRVTLYILPQPMQPQTSFLYTQDGAVQSYSWTDDDLGCAMVGDVPRDTLRALAEVAYDQLI
jgi:anti-sigma factor RsiW